MYNTCFRRIEERNCHSLGSFRAIWLPGKLHATILVSKGLTSEFPLPAKNECRSNRKSEGEDFSKWLKIILFCPLQQVGSRWWWWKKKDGRGETPPCPSQQLAQGRAGGETQSWAWWNPFVCGQPSPSTATQCQHVLLWFSWAWLWRPFGTEHGSPALGTETQHSGLP